MADKIICPLISTHDNMVECKINCAFKVSFGEKSECALVQLSSDLYDLNKYGLDVFNRDR